MLLRGQRAQRAKKQERAGGEDAAKRTTEHPSLSDPAREAHQAEARRCRKPLLPFHLPEIPHRTRLESDWIFTSRSPETERKGGGKDRWSTAEQRIILSGVGLAVESHGEKV
ncbi:hypothetical protein AMECASPLE_005813 [Ameca splendens]|uniref:Uncharacterized protein n=1 Tax=Ameca splendens TaxID=208324 RepID=A0ABV0XCA5_9TELE